MKEFHDLITKYKDYTLKIFKHKPEFKQAQKGFCKLVRC